MFTSRRRIDRPEAPWLSACLIALACCLSIRTVAAQQPAAESPAGSFKEIRDYAKLPAAQGRAVVQMLRNSSISDRALFEAFYNYKLSRLTWIENLGSIGKDIRDIKNRDLQQSRGTAHAELVAYLLNWMQRIAADEKVHPFARINAVKLIGDLNQDEGRPILGDEVPFGGAMPVLLQFVDASDPIAIAALLGIRRHAEVGITDANQRTQVARAALALINDDSRDPWVRWRSAQVLGAVGMAGADRNSSNIVDALVGLMADKKVDRSGRCAAAGSLAGIDFAGAPATLNYSKIAHTLAKLALEVGKRETDEGTAKKSVRRLLDRLDAVDIALSGRTVRQQGIRRLGAEPVREGGLLKAAADTPHADYVGAVAQNVQAMLEPLLDLAAGQSDEVPDAFSAPLEAHEAWVEKNPPPE